MHLPCLPLDTFLLVFANQSRSIDFLASKIGSAVFQQLDLSICSNFTRPWFMPVSLIGVTSSHLLIHFWHVPSSPSSFWKEGIIWSKCGIKVTLKDICFEDQCLLKIYWLCSAYCGWRGSFTYWVIKRFSFPAFIPNFVYKVSGGFVNNCRLIIEV